MSETISIHNYLDYRAFLRDFIEMKKATNPAYSVRSLAYRLKCNPGFFTRILNGERNISSALTLELAKIIRLTKKEQRYLDLLVRYNQAKKQMERDHLFELLRQSKNASVKQVSVEQFTMYSHWYYVVLRELLHATPARDRTFGTIKLLAKSLDPPVSAAEMRDAMGVLTKLGIIVKRDDGAYGPAEQFVASGEVPQVIANRILLEFADLAKRSVDAHSRDERRFSTLTFSVSRQGYEKIRERVDEFRRELLDMVKGDEAQLDRVYQCNFQLFPVTKSLSSTKGPA
jgi:uncharacterized protein (TIGR02147 family)